MLLSTGSLKFRQLEIDGANGEFPEWFVTFFVSEYLMRTVPPVYGSLE